MVTRSPGNLRVGMASPQNVAAAWVVFQGAAVTLSTASVYAVSSLTDNGAGDWTVTWAQAFQAATTATPYAVFCSAQSDGAGGSAGTIRIGVNDTDALTTTSARIRSVNGNNGQYDSQLVTVLAYGNV